MQIDYWLPNGKSMTAREDHIPRVGELVTWNEVGDYIVESVHFTMGNCCDRGMTKVSCLTITLMDAPDGRQNEEWAHDL